MNISGLDDLEVFCIRIKYEKTCRSLRSSAEVVCVSLGEMCHTPWRFHAFNGGGLGLGPVGRWSLSLCLKVTPVSIV